MAKKVCLFIIIWCLSLPLLAQEETETPIPAPDLTEMIIPTETPTATPTLGAPTPTFTPRPDVPDYVYDWHEELLYPVAVYFFLVIDRPLTAIQDIRLVLTVEGEVESRILEFAEIALSTTVREPFTEFKLVWLIPPQNPLPLNALIEYEWQVTLSETQSTRIPGVFAYQNPQIQWVVDIDPQNQIDLLMPVLEDLTPAGIRNRFTPIYDQLTRNTGSNTRFRFALQSDDYPFEFCKAGMLSSVAQGMLK